MECLLKHFSNLNPQKVFFKRIQCHHYSLSLVSLALLRRAKSSGPAQQLKNKKTISHPNHTHPVAAMSPAESMLLDGSADSSQRSSSSLYSSYVDSSFDTDSIISTTSQDERDAFYRNLVAERLDQLLDRLGFLRVRHIALQQELGKAKQACTELMWEIFRLDPGRGLVEPMASRPRFEQSVAEDLQDAAGGWLGEELRRKQEALVAARGAQERLEEQIRQIRKGTEQGVELLWKVLKERVRLGSEPGREAEQELAQTTTSPGGLPHRAPAVDPYQTPVSQILGLFDRCSRPDLEQVHAVLTRMLHPGLQTPGGVPPPSGILVRPRVPVFPGHPAWV